MDFPPLCFTCLTYLLVRPSHDFADFLSLVSISSVVTTYHESTLGKLTCVWERCHGLVYSAFDFYFEVKQLRARLVLGWVTAWVLECEACPTHWTGCQVSQVVNLLGLGSMVAICELLITAIRHVSWVNMVPLDNGGFSGYSGFLPQLNKMRRKLITWIW